jgi:hypothetical protein
MQLEGDAYNWYMWWNKIGYAINWNKFKDDFFKRFQGIKEEDCFTKLTKLQLKGHMNNFTREWEILATRLPGLSIEHLVQSYITSLKPDPERIEVTRYHNEKTMIASSMETSGHQGTNVEPKNHVDMRLRMNLTPLVATLRRKKRGKKTSAIDAVKSGL